MLIPWQVDAVKVLTRRELTAVLDDLDRQAARSASARMNGVVFRLACCCGLRVSEIAALRVGDVCVGGGRPHLRVGPEGAKGKRARTVPLWWDGPTLDALAAWRREREASGAGPADRFVCCLWPSRFGEPLQRHTLRERFRTACMPLGLDRVRRITIHHGRHTFVSHALAGGRTLAEVKAAAGHSSLLTTSVYLHIAVDDDATPGRLFGR